MYQQNFTIQNRIHRALGQPTTKKLKRDTNAKVPIMYCDIIRGTKPSSNPKKKNKHYSKIPVRCLLDSGCSATIGRKGIVDEIYRSTDGNQWHTAAGVFTTTGKSKVKLQLTELSPTAILEEKINVTEQDFRPVRYYHRQKYSRTSRY